MDDEERERLERRYLGKDLVLMETGEPLGRVTGISGRRLVVNGGPRGGGSHIPVCTLLLYRATDPGMSRKS
ncbi:MAG: hypothetical protein KJ600_06005 [Nanoarchaeota archaeon]|nr:hypothetical protein [Nanoarchaeota archaeon]MBU1104081.1 hypothetical protein [Nanoarchaeota archaeon]